MGDCAHQHFNEDGVCTQCREFYSRDHDQRPGEIHPAMKRLVDRMTRSCSYYTTEPAGSSAQPPSQLSGDM